ncbi:MAG TPA: 4'-phosphopantetheinyl transferase superfamily protein [Candidatus Sulfotelmatobacter sp.]|nr:4'-phosphopantetheinyl transferase superfamily protein [Candidatus Sulfotelmatobacter sp.]
MDIYWLEQTESDAPTGNQWLGAKETLCLSSLRFAKRRADWRLGRWTAKQAVAACLNLPTDLHALADIEIHAASSGAPEVFIQNQPANLAISLSHRDGTALCAVAPAGTSVGCDLETIEPRSDAFVADYFTAAEKALIAQTPGEKQPLLVALLWSGKESALKALRVGLRLDTRSICVSPAHTWPQSAAKKWQDLGPTPLVTSPDDWRPLRVRYSGGHAFAGWWRFQDHLVRTYVSDLPLRTP